MCGKPTTKKTSTKRKAADEPDAIAGAENPKPRGRPKRTSSVVSSAIRRHATTRSCKNGKGPKPTTQNDSSSSFRCKKILLLRAGVERNPGPRHTQTETTSTISFMRVVTTSEGTWDEKARKFLPAEVARSVNEESVSLRHELATSLVKLREAEDPRKKKPPKKVLEAVRQAFRENQKTVRAFYVAKFEAWADVFFSSADAAPPAKKPKPSDDRMDDDAEDEYSDAEDDVLTALDHNVVIEAVAQIEDANTRTCSSMTWSRFVSYARANEDAMLQQVESIRKLKEESANNSRAIEDICDRQERNEFSISQLCDQERDFHERLETVLQTPGTSKNDIARLVKDEVARQKSELKAELLAELKAAVQNIEVTTGFSEENFEILKAMDVSKNEKKMNSVVLLGVPEFDGKDNAVDGADAAMQILPQFGADQMLLSKIKTVYRRGAAGPKPRPLVVETLDEEAGRKLAKGQYHTRAKFGGSNSVTIKYNRTGWHRTALRRMYAVAEYAKKHQPSWNMTIHYGAAMFGSWRVDSRDFKRPWLKVRDFTIKIDEICALPEFSQRFQWSEADD